MAMLHPLSLIDFEALYHQFDAPLAAFDCGAYCAPHNPSGAPFCCDTRHAVPAVYRSEWRYLRENTDLWHRWQGRTEAENRRMQQDTPRGMVLLECQGYQLCQRNFRAITCRAFPFFPYITREGDFLGLSYYWQFEYACWVISNLQIVTAQYRADFIAVYNNLLYHMPGELEGYRALSASMRRVFSRWKRAIPLLHHNGGYYKVTPRNGRLRRVTPEQLPKFDPYR